jgi:hypothetical protein
MLDDAVLNELNERLSKEWCSSFEVRRAKAGGFVVDVPALHGDGDGIPIFLDRREGRWVLSDQSGTVDRLFIGSLTEAKRKWLENIAAGVDGVLTRDLALEVTLDGEPSVYDIGTFISQLGELAGPRHITAETRSTRYSTQIKQIAQRWVRPDAFQLEWTAPMDARSLYASDFRVQATNRADGIIVFAVRGDAAMGRVAGSIWQFRDWGVRDQLLVAHQKLSSNDVFRLQDAIRDDSAVISVDTSNPIVLRRALERRGADLLPI